MGIISSNTITLSEGYLEIKDTFNYRHVRIHIGKGLVAMEVGIRYPERNFLKYTDAIQIEERLITIPITIQWTTPDYFAGHYYTVFLSYTIKELLASACISKQRDNRPVPIATKGANTFFHSVVIGVSWLFPFGVYLRGGFDFPLRPSNNLSAYYAQRTSDHIDGHGLKDYRCLLCLGIDIIMLIRACYGMSFNNSNPKITDL